jgi:hypothetical protein
LVKIEPMTVSGRRFRQGTERAGRGAPAGRRAGESPLVIESCHSTWVIDQERRRFRRVLKGLDLDTRHASTDWRGYHSFEIDELTGGFVLWLNESGSRVMRSRRHTERCADCGGEVTSELSLDEVVSLLSA